MLILVYMLLTVLRSVSIVVICSISSTRMHDEMTRRLARAKILFFDSNPMGRILTRFSKDTNMLDSMIPVQLQLATHGIFRTLTVGMVVCVIYPYMLLAILVAVVSMILIIRFGIQAMRET